MFVVAKLDFVIEHEKLCVGSNLSVTAVLLAGRAADLTVGPGAVGARNVLDQLHHSLGLGRYRPGNARLSVAVDTRHVLVR